MPHIESNIQGKPTVERIQNWYTDLASLYSQRNAEYDVLRNVFDSQFVSSQPGAVIRAGEFQDKKRLIFNMINTSIRRFMDEMSSPHRVQCIPRGFKKEDIELAERRQKALERMKEQESLNLKVIQAAYYQGLLDKATWHVRPNPTKEFKVDIDLIVPETYFPIPRTDNWNRTDAIIIAWRPVDIKHIDTTQVDPIGEQRQDVQQIDERIIEYWDPHWYIRVENGVETVSIRHDLGFLPFEDAHNIPIPHRHRGQGDGDQSVGLNSYLNELISNQADVLDYLANPIIVVRGSRTGTQNLTWGPRAIWELERDASAEILTWQGAPPTFEAQILRTMQGIEDNTGLSSPAFGREIPSGVSGEAVRSILAGFNTRVGTKQILMGIALASLYKKVQAVWESMFPNAEMMIPGEGDDGESGIKFQPKEIKGFYDVRVIFEPQNESVRVFTELQKLEKGVQSKLRTMRNLGIANPEDEMRRINIERSTDIRLTMAMNAMQGGGQLGPDGQPVAPIRQPFNTALVPELGEALGASDPGSLGDLLSGAEPGTNVPGQGEIEIRDVIDLVGDEDLDGRAFLSGAIVKEGMTTGKFDLVVEKPSDVAKLRQALGALAARANFRVKKQVRPSENLVSVARPRTPRPRDLRPS